MTFEIFKEYITKTTFFRNWWLSLYIISTLSMGQTNKDIARADAYYKVGQYNNAVKYYTLRQRKTNASYTLSKLANCYRKLNKPDLVMASLNKLKSKTALTQPQWLELCNAIKMQGKYKEAKQLLKRFNQKYPENMEGQSLLASCDSSLYWLTFPKDNIEVENLSNLNTSFSEISAFPHDKALYFASNREQYIIKNRPGGGELPFYVLYKAEIDSVGIHKKVRALSISGSKNTHESSIAFSHSGDKVFFTQHAGNENDSVQTHAHLKIFYMESEKGKWRNPHAFIFNDSTSSFAHPYLSKDGKMFFFVSDMNGGLGGSDIYFCLLKDSLWSLPINIGSPVNSKGNEIFPFYDEENHQLYFASDGHIGLGGYDLFIATEKEGEFTIKNMQVPVNSPADDFGLIFDRRKKGEGYLISNRAGGHGLEDIYKVVVK